MFVKAREALSTSRQKLVGIKPQGFLRCRYSCWTLRTSAQTGSMDRRNLRVRSCFWCYVALQNDRRDPTWWTPRRRFQRNMRWWERRSRREIFCISDRGLVCFSEASGWEKYHRVLVRIAIVRWTNVQAQLIANLRVPLNDCNVKHVSVVIAEVVGDSAW